METTIHGSVKIIRLCCVIQWTEEQEGQIMKTYFDSKNGSFSMILTFGCGLRFLSGPLTFCFFSFSFDCDFPFPFFLFSIENNNIDKSSSMEIFVNKEFREIMSRPTSL